MWCPDKFDKEGATYPKEYNNRGQYIAKDKPIQQHDRLCTIYDNVQHLEFFGGEPLLNITQFELLEHLVESGRSKDITLYYNTNATQQTPERLQRAWKEFKSIEISCSIDGIEDKFEYPRWS